MKRLLVMATLSLLILYLSAPLGVAQTGQPAADDKEAVDQAVLPGLKTDGKLKQSSWDLDRLFDDALDQLPAFVSDIPASIKKVSVVRIDGDENIYVNTVSLKFKLQKALIESGRFQVVECRQCNNMKVYVEDESLILSRAVESNDQIARLGRELGIDAYIQGVVTINEAVGKVQLGMQLIDITDGTILKSASLDSFFLETKKDDAQTAAAAADKKSGLVSTHLNLEILFPKLLAKIPGELNDLPADIKRVALADLQGDGFYDINTRRLQHLFETTLVNASGVTIIECPMCAVQQDFAVKDAAVFITSASTAKRMQKLSEQVGFDAYIKSNLKIHEEDQKLEFNFKVINAKTSEIVKAVSLKTLDDDKIIEPDSEHSFTLLPFTPMTLKGDANWEDNEFKYGAVNAFLGVQYRYLTTTILDNLLIGGDLDYFVPSVTEDEKIGASIYIISFIAKYRLPFKFGVYRMFDVAFGYGVGSLSSELEGERQSVSFNPIKLEGTAKITPSLSVGLAAYLLGTHELEWETDDGDIGKQTFNGDSLNIVFRYTF